MDRDAPSPISAPDLWGEYAALAGNVIFDSPCCATYNSYVQIDFRAYALFVGLASDLSGPDALIAALVT